MNAKEINILLRNNTGNKDKDSLIESFVIRTKIFNNIFSEIKLSRTDKPEQNYLVIGQRGAGKTTLLYRLKYAIEDDQDLSMKLIPIMFSEEQYNLLDLINLWESIAEYLEEFDEFDSLTEEISNIDFNIHREEAAYELLEKALTVSDKKIILFIENIDVFFKKIGKHGQKRLREVLTTTNRVRLICSSTTYFESIINYSDPFYDFFKIIQLKGLNASDSIKLLEKLAEQKNVKSEIQKVAKEHPKRLESLRRLTGGNPRIISYLFQIFLDNENGKAIIDLYKLLDDITFLYKAELDQLSAQQQKVIDAIARNWDAISTKEISLKTNIDSKHISSILNTLEKNQTIESINTKTKNNLYRLRDRFLNIWYLMRFGKKREKENVIWLVRFFDTWCDQSELSQRIVSYMDDVKAGKYDVIAALDMGNVFLSCENISHEVKYDIYKTTKSFLPKKFIQELIISEDSLDASIRKLVKNKDWDKAIEALAEVKSKELKAFLQWWIYTNKKENNADIILANEGLEELYILKNDGEFAEILGDYFRALNILEKAIYYYEEGVNHKHWSSYFKLGNVYLRGLMDYAQAEKYYRLAIKHGIVKAKMALAEVLFLENELDESSLILEKEIKNDQKGLKTNLGLIYLRQGKTKKAISIFEEAISEGEKMAMIKLGMLYLSQERPDFNKAKELFETAISDGLIIGYHALGKLFIKQGDSKEGEKYYLMGVENKDAESAHSLGHFYAKKDWKKAEKFFLNSIKWGKTTSLHCMSAIAFQQKRNNRKEAILELFEKHIKDVEKRLLMVIEYSRYLLWDNQIEKSVKFIKKHNKRIFKILHNSQNEEYKEDVIFEMTSYFILLISKGQYNMAHDLLIDSETNYRQILKPVYFTLMGYMKDSFPNEYLKAGEELQETIKEINEKIEEYKISYS